MRATTASVESDNYSMTPPDVDCYLLYLQNFMPGGDNTVAIKSGMVTSVVYTFDQLKIQQPPWVTSGFGVNSVDLKLLDRLGKKLLLTSWNKSAARVFNALEWFRLAHTAGDHISFEPRVSMTASAYESLFDLPPNQKAVPLMQKIDLRISDSKLRKKSFTFRDTKHSFTHAAAFVYEFYKLRNAIVHGEKINPERLRYSNRYLKKQGTGQWLTRLIVADVLLYELIWAELSKRSDEICLLLKFSSAHEALGWSKAA